MAQHMGSGYPAQGLYTPENEHDACGVAFVATLRGTPGHDIVEQALEALTNLEHRGAVGADPDSGDGAGILTQLPDAFLRRAVPFDLPPLGHYAAGTVFLPAESPDAAAGAIEDICAAEGLTVLGWRDVPTTPGLVGRLAATCQPVFRQIFITHPTKTGMDLERLVYCARKQAERVAYIASLSTRTMLYKGMLTTEQLGAFFPDLRHPDYATTLAVVHSRFSTNTFPSWPLAHPYRYVAHNGEINTVRGNRNWMRARESMVASPHIPGDISRLFPVCTPGASDSASFDEVLEFLHMAGRPLPHAVLMMIPEAWENHETMDPARRAFYEYHALFMEPWDGPADLVFTDGTLVGAVLDRNGLRPSRWTTTSDGLVVLASETGVLDLDPATVTASGRLQPGKMFLVDTEQGRIVDDNDVKDALAAEQPYGDWLRDGLVHLAELPEREHIAHTRASVKRRQQTFGYTTEELRVLIEPMARTGAEPIGSMGTDTPIAVLSTRTRLLFDYFTQLFAQVTNPPLDAIREELVTSLRSTIGPEGNICVPTPEQCRQVVIDFPVIDNDQLSKIAHLNRDGDQPRFATTRVKALYAVDGGEAALRRRIDEICDTVSAEIADGARFIILSDRDSDADRAPIPSLLITAAVHHHLVREKTRTKVGLLVEAGDVREVHHVALLVGYGAAAVNPYLAMETAEDMCRPGQVLAGTEPEHAVANLLKALGKGVLKVMSKMGISTVESYRGAQVFEAIGLSQDLIDQYFTGTVSTLGGVGLDVLAREAAARHAVAYPAAGAPAGVRRLTTGGEYQWRRDGEEHLFDPETVFRLQHATRSKRYDIFTQYTDRVDDHTRRCMTLRGLFELRSDREPIPLDDVEPREAIMKRFSTGAMSYGSISAEAHETLAVAMNRIGGKSNTGEGGEDVERLLDPTRRSAIKQVASGRFGVTSMYLTHADDIQIKMAQGAKPGEGGQLPGHKVYPWVAKTRHSTPGVGLISPPPHHDIYSIEDLAQLIHDLKNANPSARIHVKLVAENGVGTIAAGVSKAHADVVLISGHDGGTGASPLTSLKHAGGPWELGLAETQQTLLLNGLRDRIVVQCDGQLKTGRDVIIAALLGAEEYGFATAPLVVSGCVMMRVCHLDTCPVGIATQNPELRDRYTGKPEFVETFFEFLADQVRGYLADLGFRSLDEAIGNVHCLDTRAAVQHWKTDGLDLAPIFHAPAATSDRRCTTTQDHGLDAALDHELIAASRDALTSGKPTTYSGTVRNVNRTVGTMLGHEVTTAHGEHGLPPDTIDITLTGNAGQSFGAFLPAGITLRLRGAANDYVGKGLSGGRITVAPDDTAAYDPATNVIAGNTIAYGATSGEIFLRGRVGERFCVRNSGAVAVVEGIGDHGCEYMTGGTVVILGPTGRNFAAGMSGGTAYLLDADLTHLNPTAHRGGDLLVTELDAEHAGTVQALLTAHADATGSDTARTLLGEWPASMSRFTTITPRQYTAVTHIVAQAERDGIDPSSPHVWANIVEAHHG